MGNVAACARGWIDDLPGIVVNGNAYAQTIAGIQAAINALPSAGGIIYLAAGTYPCVVGTGLSTSKSDVTIIGAGDSTLLDFSTETGAVNSLTFTGDRIRLSCFKISGGRTVGSTGSAVVFSGVDTGVVNDLTITNSGGYGVYCVNATDIHVTNCRVTSSYLSGVFCDSGLTGLWVRDNTFTTCVVGDGAGHSSIAVRGNVSGSAMDSDIHILDNKILQTSRTGITVNGGSTQSFQTSKVFIRGNHINQTGLGASQAGEGIAVTANEAIINGNRVDKSSDTGILLYAAASNCVISSNVVSNASQSTLATHGAIQLNATTAFGDGVIRGTSVLDNICYDDQAVPTQSDAINIFHGSGGSYSGCSVGNNIGFGNVSAIVEFSSAGDIANFLQSGTFTVTAAGVTTVINPYISVSSYPLVFPTNAAAGLLLRTKTCYVSTGVAGSFAFNVSSTGAGAPAGTETFGYSF